MFKRKIALLLSAAMVFSTAAPVSVFAEEGQEPILVSSSLEDADEVNDISTGESTDPDENLSENGPESEGVVSDQENDTEVVEEETEQDADMAEDVETPENTEEEAPETEKVPEVKAELSADEKIMTLTATGMDPEATSVVFPTWSSKNGQDDLEWANGVKQEDGSWKAEITVAKHRDVGEYLIHVYQNVKGVQSFACKTTATVSAPTGTVVVEDLDEVNGTFSVRLTDLNVPSGITKVEFPTWGEVGGQNDLVWHKAIKDGEDYIVKVDATQHQYENGLYNIHCYVTDGNGSFNFVNKTTTTLKLDVGLTAELNAEETSIKVVAKGIDPAATEVQLPTWSDKNGQDDLKWIKAVKTATGVWSADIPVKGHRDPGEYLIHCYQVIGGKQKFFAKTSVTVAAPTGTVTASEVDEKTGVFEVSLSDLSVPSGVKQVQFAVWGDEGGQNDLVWHTGVKSGDKYTAVITPGEHKFEMGTYQIHCYVTDQNDIFAFAGKTSAEMKMEEGISATVSADQKSVQIQYIGPKANQSLRAAVWSDKDGQDDLIWYSMKQNGNGASATVNIGSHKTAGTYYVHVYTKDTKFVDKTEFSIDAINRGTVTVSEVDGNKGTFKVTVSGLSNPSGFEKVTIPVWANGTQSNINWYTATKSGDDYVCTVNAGKHGNLFGHYDIHVYAYANNGVWGFAGNTATELEADRYLYTEKTGTYTTRVWLLNAGADAEGVTFRAWSDANGQDDVVTYTGVKSGSNDYYADIPSKSHKNGGNYTAEGYVTVAGSSELAGSVSFSMAKEGEAKNQAMYQYAQGFSSDTPYLILVNRALHRVAVYQGSKNNWKEIQYWPCVVGKPSTPTPTGTFKIKGRFNYFGDGHLCWWCTQIEGYYYFHTVLYYTDTAPIRVLDGTMDAAASAGCIRLEEPNARWIYTTIPRGTTVHIYN